MKKRKDGRYAKKIKLLDGTTKFLYSSASSERAAMSDFNEQMQKLKQEQANLTLFVNVAERWSAEHFPKMQNNTLKMYNPGLKEAKEYFKNLHIETIKPLHVNEYIESLTKKGYAAKTIKGRMLVLNLIFKHAILLEYIHSNPCQYITVPKGLPKKKRLPATADETKLITANTDKEFGTLAYFFLFTGCRRGEALAITPDDIDIENKTVSINKTVEWLGSRPQIKNSPKTDAGNREIPLTDKLIELLKPFMNQKYIFQNANGELFNNSQVTRGWENYQKETGITATPHQLRHSYQTMLFDAGIDVKTAQKWLGHADIKTTLDIYTHLSENRLAQSTEKLLNFITENYE